MTPERWKMFRTKRMKQAVWNALYFYRECVKEGELWKATAAMAEFRQALGVANFKASFWSPMEIHLMEDTDDEYLRLLNSHLGPESRLKGEDGLDVDFNTVGMPTVWRRV